MMHLLPSSLLTMFLYSHSKKMAINFLFLKLPVNLEKII